MGDVRGKGLMVALELVSDRTNKTPVERKTLQQVSEAVYQPDVMIRVSGPDINLSPSLIITAGCVPCIVGALDAGLAQVERAG